MKHKKLFERLSIEGKIAVSQLLDDLHYLQSLPYLAIIAVDSHEIKDEFTKAIKRIQKAKEYCIKNRDQVAEVFSKLRKNQPFLTILSLEEQDEKFNLDEVVLQFNFQRDTISEANLRVLILCSKDCLNRFEQRAYDLFSRASHRIFLKDLEQETGQNLSTPVSKPKAVVKLEQQLLEIDELRKKDLNEQVMVNLLLEAGNNAYETSQLGLAMNLYKEGLNKSTNDQYKGIFLGNIGIIHEEFGDRNTALKYYHKALDIHLKTGDLQSQATQLSNMGVVLQALGENNKAMEKYKESFALNKLINNHLGQSVDLQNIGLVYYGLAELKKALANFQSASDLSSRIGYDKGEGNNLGCIGLIQKRMGNLDKALKFYQKALSIHQSIGYRTGEAMQLGNIAMIYDQKGESERALKYHKETLKIYEKTGSANGQAEVLNRIGGIKVDNGEFDQALFELEKAKMLYEKTDDKIGQASVLANIGHAFAEMKKYDDALKYFALAREIRKSTGNRDEIAFLDANIATLDAVRNKDFTKVLEINVHALEVFKSTNNRLGQALQLGRIGSIQTELGNFKDALIYHFKALELNRKIAHLKGEVSDLNDIGEVYSKKGHREKALKFFNEALVIAKAMENKKLIDTITENIRQVDEKQS